MLWTFVEGFCDLYHHFKARQSPERRYEKDVFFRDL